ncbi:MAG TPA: hypothetical protein DCL76_07285 [Chloroflexi bacterium]|nr:hypothetical protein [Chloroflexota bacterium]HCU98596.1 hypothetical protein [Chloroflexota bacterium]|tara:strand:- start:292 stop:516 length:225 start_codon:yes stop_codon:yes gene_type:complete
MLSNELLEILRCPSCVQSSDGNLELTKGSWLVCKEDNCGRKYPIKKDIPVMLIEEGDKWVNVKVSELPLPPPVE